MENQRRRLMQFTVAASVLLLAGALWGAYAKALIAFNWDSVATSAVSGSAPPLDRRPPEQTEFALFALG